MEPNGGALEGDGGEHGEIDGPHPGGGGRRRMTSGAAASLRPDGRDCGSVKLDPPSAGTATDGTTSRHGSAGQGSTTE